MGKKTNHWSRARVWIIILGIILLIGVSVLSVWQKGIFNVGADIGGSIPNRIGIIDHDTYGQYKRIADIKGGFTKILGDWKNIQTSPEATPNFANFDARAKLIIDKGLEPIGQIRSNAPWAMPEDNSGCSPNTVKADSTNQCSNLPKPEYQTTYKNFVRDFIIHEAEVNPSVKYWEIENEQDQNKNSAGLDVGKWGSHSTEYVELLKLARQAFDEAKSVNTKVKEVDPKIVLGGLTGPSIQTIALCDDGLYEKNKDKCSFYPNNSWINDPKSGAYEAKDILIKGRDYYDVIGIHPYITIAQLQEVFDSFNVWLQKHVWSQMGDQKKEVWASESGGPLIEGRWGGRIAEPNTEQETANQIVKRSVIALGAGYARNVWYVMSSYLPDDTSINSAQKERSNAMAIYTGEQKGTEDKDIVWTPRPTAAQAFKLTSETLNHAASVSKILVNNSVSLYKVTYLGTALPVWIAWSTDNNARTVDLSAYIPAKTLEVTTNGQDIAAGIPSTVNISSIPTFIHPTELISPVPITKAYCTNGVCQLQRGYNTVTSDKGIVPNGFYSAGMTVFEFNTDGEKTWRQTNSQKPLNKMLSGRGYYVYTPVSRTVSNAVDEKTLPGELSGVSLYKGWNLLSNSSDQAKPLSILKYYVPNSNATCVEIPFCRYDLKAISQITSRIYHKIVIIKDGSSTDADKAFQYIELSGADLTKVAIPAHTAFWVYLKN